MRVRSVPIDYRSISLTPEEGFVLSRIGGSCSLPELATLTGMELGRLESIVRRLTSQGVVAVEACAEGMAAPPRGGHEVAECRDPRASLSGLDRELPPGVEALLTPLESELPIGIVEPLGLLDSSRPEAPAIEAAAAGSLSVPEGRDHRRLYQQRFAALSPAARAEQAQTARGAELCALCLDPDPRIIAALLANSTFGLNEARLVAAHHPNARGLDLLGQRAAFLRDGQVVHALLRNGQASDLVLRRILQRKRLLELFRICVARELPERTRSRVSRELRARFADAASEEKAELVYRTEGRVLLLLAGAVFDGRTTAILCGKTYSSTLLVQNLVRFPSTPPPLLARLVQQPLVGRNPALKQLLLRHPNLPSQAKRRS